MSPRRYVLPALAVVATLSLATAALAVRAQPKALSSLTVRINADWATLDFMTRVTQSSVDPAAPAYDRLVALSPDEKKYVPYLATSWTQTSKKVTFTLRRDAKCTDGHVLTAVDVLNSFKHFIFVPKTVASAASSPVGGWGPGPYHIHANNKKSLFTLAVDKPYRNLLSLFANIGVVCPAGLAAVQTDPRALEAAVYGSGPYTLDSALHGNQISYKLRPDWKWGPPGTSAKTMPQQLTFKVITDETTAANLLLTGGLDVSDIAGADVDRLLGNAALVHKTVPNYYVQSLIMNMRPGRVLADDEKLRQAIMTAVDPKAWNAAADAGRGTLVTSVFPTDLECYDPKTKALMPKPSIDVAKQLMQQGGWTFTAGKAFKNGQQLKLTVLGNPSMNAGPDYLTSVMQQLGADVTESVLAQAAYNNATLNGNFDVQGLRGNRSLPNPGDNFSALWGPASPGGLNLAFTGGGDPDYLRFVNAGYQNAGAGGCKYFALAQQQILKKHYALPMVQANTDLFYSNKLVMPLRNAEFTIIDPFYIKAK
jgi:peptide/nickel transport system substrate-binding protein